MLVCPICGAENLEGVDACEHCQQPLMDMFLRVPTSSIEADLLQDRVDAIPHHPPVTFSPEATVGDVLNGMVDKGIGCVLIVDDAGALAGIFSERDALTRLEASGTGYHELPIEQFMTPNPAVCESDAKIAFALHRMNIGGYRHLPLVKEGKPVSVVSIRDMLKYLTEHATV